MGPLFSYSIYSAILLIVLYLTYKWILAGENQHRANRAILLGIYVVSMCAWPAGTLLRSLMSAPDRSAGGAVVLEIPVAGLADVAPGNVAADILLWVYVAGMAAVTLHTVSVWVRLARIVASGRKSRCGAYTLVLTDRDDIAPFSWWRYIVMSGRDYSEAGEMIICHESRHLRLRHPLDLIVAQLVAIVEWWNPAAWLMREELKTVHEYQADSCVLASGINARDYQMLLIKKAVGARFPSLANSLNHSKLKKRITMMYNQKMSAKRRMRSLALIPTLAAAIFVTNLPAVATVVSDAGAASLSRDSMHPGQTVGKVNTISAPPQESGDENVYDAVEVMPQYPGGPAEMLNYIAANMKYPAEAEQKGIEGRVVVNFVVGKTGKVSDVKVIRSVDPLLDEEAVRVVGTLPDFTPGQKDGKPVAVYYTLPVSFKLKADTGSGNSTFVATRSDRPSNVKVVTMDGQRNITLNGKPVSQEELKASGTDMVVLTGDSKTTTSTLGDAVVMVDGNEISQAEMGGISPSQIESMSIDKSGDKTVIRITLKK